MARKKNDIEAPAGDRLIATARNDITIPYYSTVLMTTDEVLIQKGGGRGLQIYEELERDSHAFAVLQKRKNALVAREWVVEAASDDPRDQDAAEFVEEELNRLPFDRICVGLLDATLKGFAVAEIEWGRRDARIVPERIVAQDQRRFVFDDQWRLRLLTREAPMDGVELPERKFIVHRYGVKGNNPYGLGLGSKLFWPVLFKREGVAFWLTYLDKYASPTPYAKYPLGMTEEEQRKLFLSLQQMRQSSALIAPLGTELDTLEAKQAGGGGYAEWCSYWDTQMSLAVFGSNLATQVMNEGSRAATETHKESEEQIIDADGDLLTGTLGESLIRWMTDFNFPGAGVPVVRRVRSANQLALEELRKKKGENAKAEMEALAGFAEKVPPEHFAALAASLADIDLMPRVPDEVLQKLAPHLASARRNLVAAARNGKLPLPANANDPDAEIVRQIAFAGHGHADGHDHGIRDLARQLADVAQPHVDEWVDRIRAELETAVAAGEGLAEFSDRLLRLDRELQIDPMGRLLAGAMATAELTGMGDVKDEIAAKTKKVR